MAKVHQIIIYKKNINNHLCGLTVGVKSLMSVEESQITMKMAICIVKRSDFRSIKRFFSKYTSVRNEIY